MLQYIQLCFFVYYFIYFIYFLHASDGPKKKLSREPLFEQNDPNITYLTDGNFETIVTNSKEPWLVDFYHPYCPHCRSFVPEWIKIAAFYKINKNPIIHIGALSCMDHVKCRRVKIDGFPSLLAFNFNPKISGYNERMVGTHSINEVKDFVNRLIEEGIANATGKAIVRPAKTKETNKKQDIKKTDKKTEVIATTLPVTIWEESTEIMTNETRIRDASAAFIFGLNDGVFFGREELEDSQLDALKEWIRIVSLTFPGTFHRYLINQLYQKIVNITFLHVDGWLQMIKVWQNNTVNEFKKRTDYINQHYTNIKMRKWQNITNLFTNDGSNYEACALYTCGQWNMFHMMTITPTYLNDNELYLGVIMGIRRFIKHFFGCAQCREHFLAYNNMNMLKEAATAKDKKKYLRFWLWKMHNAVNKRIGHPLWPKPSICPSCIIKNDLKLNIIEWNNNQVDKWLIETYGFQDEIIYNIDDTNKTTLLYDKIVQREKTSIENSNDILNKKKNHVENNKITNQGENKPFIFMWYIIPISSLFILFYYLKKIKKKHISYRKLPYNRRSIS